ncbi:phosphatidylglycerophosphatase A [Terasakiella sp. SH-1]|uniref:phosphatidylglycerophosphatase A family protein n=1 Tax=Terasakiella sp. SH-1 TaxID=2560057 RepID=UPI001073B176|nr:phosphatidylglycerophosphatase A [Terasakiella sp. SH-1]
MSYNQKLNKEFLLSPAGVLATWFGSGLLPKAPGTWGSLAALPFAWGIQYYTGWIGLSIATVLVFLIGWWAAHAFEEKADVKDPGAVVIDEVAGQWLVLIPAGLDLKLYIIGFFLFRLVDIFKPWPACWFDRHVHGGLGIMLDDVVAALYGLIAIYFIQIQLSGM